MSDKLKVGIVGCGAVAKERHIPSFLKVKRNVTLQAVCDRNENLAREVAKKYGIPGVYPDILEMLTRENLDIVDICVPQQIHAPLAIQALEHGCHVLIEKPMALKTSECDEMIEASRKNGAKLCIVHNALFHPPFLKARELVAKGTIGDFTGMRIYMSDHRDEMIMRKDYWVHKLPGGVIGESGPHAVYMSLAFLNKVNNVDVFAKNFLEHSWAPFDEFRMELEGENAVSSITISYASNRHNCYVDILGTEGALHLDLNSMLLIRQRERDSLRPVNLACYSLGIVDSILNNSRPPVTGEEGREVIRVMEMIVQRLREKYDIS